MDITNLLQKELVFTSRDEASRDALLRAMAGELESRGYVKASFADAVIERENKYPTGLPTDTIRIAVPHTDVVHVKKSCISIARLTRPVAFKLMGDNCQDVEAEMVFLLALGDAKAHLDVLQKVIALFSDRDVLARLKAAATAEEIYDTVVGAVKSR